jgi:nucleotide-binding universal stress UspA family protein
MKEYAMQVIRTILHPTDFSKSADLAFRLACSLAQFYSARIHVLHVGKAPVIAPVEGIERPEPERYQEDLTAKLHMMRAEDLHIQVEHQLLFVGDPAPEILRVAQAIKADMIVMGTHGRSGLARLLMGSVAEQVVRKAPCPVVTVRMPLPETRLSGESASQTASNPAMVTKG